MKNFEYQNPVKIIFGRGKITELGKEIPMDHKIMLTYGGGSIFANGIYNQVITALQNHHIIEFGGIEANPSYETCMEAVKLARQEKVTFLLAVGGGSVLDGTKFIAAAIQYDEGDPWDFLDHAKKVRVTKALPIGTVLTLPATGSEMNGNSVISRKSTTEKIDFSSPFVLPRFSVLDPECVFSLPERQIGNGVVDAFVHVMEQYLTYPVNSPLQDRLAEGILLTLVEEGPKILADKYDYDTAANFMWTATLALNGLISKGVPEDWSTHHIGHELTAFHGIDHARTLAIVLPGVMNIRRKQKEEKILQYGDRVWGIKTGTVEERVDKTIAATEEFFHKMGMPLRLSECGVSYETINKITSRFEMRKSLLGEQADIDSTVVRAILEDRF